MLGKLPTKGRWALTGSNRRHLPCKGRYSMAVGGNSRRNGAATNADPARTSPKVRTTFGPLAGIAIPAALRRGPVVYFIGTEDGPIKIGRTNELPQRLRSLQNASPVPIKLLAARPGTAAIEREYHRVFAASRLHGEWFKLTPEIEEELGHLWWRANCSLPFKSIPPICVDTPPLSLPHLSDPAS